MTMAVGSARRCGRSTPTRWPASGLGRPWWSGTPTFPRCPSCSTRPGTRHRSWTRSLLESLMPSLVEVQRQFADALLGVRADDAVAAVAGDGVAPEARVAVYRHHVVSSLTAALRSTYPVVSRLVGDGFFAYAAREFITTHQPA